jgi:lipopolysaccharide transport protein LptA
MNKRFSVLIILVFSILAFATYPTLVRSETSLKTFIGSGTGSITITAAGPGEIANDKKNNIITMIWSDKVHATYNDLILDCDKLEMSSINTAEKDNKEKKQTVNDAVDSGKIARIVITGNVKITGKDGFSASGEKIVYDKADGKAVITGNPAAVKQGNNVFESSKITYDLKEGKTFFEGSDSSKNKAVIFPGELKGKSIVP